MLMCQIFVYAVFALSPAIFIMSLKYSLNNVWYHIHVDNPWYTSWVWYGVIFLYIAFVVRHRWTTFEAVLFYCMIFLNALIMILSTAVVTTTGTPFFFLFYKYLFTCFYLC